MIVTSTTETVPFTPAWLEGKPNAPVFNLRAASVIERGQMEAELAGPHRAGRILGYELMIAIRSGIATLLADDPELDRVQGLIEAEAANETDDFTEEDKRVLVEMRAVLAEHWPEYRDLVAQLERRNQIAPIVALRRFCTGWDNVVTDAGDPVPYARGRDGQITEESLAKLQPLELLVAGNRAYSLQYGADQAGNSPRPSQSDDGPTTSRSDAPSTADGKSASGAGKRTRGSRSLRKSGQS
ncbi:hypothetical protein [Sphingomonas sp. PAMC 26621]|uniref:hypothetical protein n=1 Tax=Sphingomonas sp. PAMC 26621 TaxID=1112213 RepID=UPI0002888DCE|nr:hypothetical protein [Sphingomonas sp. PAMC 26621]